MSNPTEVFLAAYPEFEHYPTSTEIDDLADCLWAETDDTQVVAERLETTGFGHALALPHMGGYTYVRFEPEGRSPFFGYWQPAPSQPAPLLVHTPGYGARISLHPDLVIQGYNVLHVNPLGYATPDGADEAKRRGADDWPVFRDTVSGGLDEGYRPWLLDVMAAVTWAAEQPEVLADRVSFFGTSQGGGATLLLGSIFRGRGVRCLAADEPWLVNFPLYRSQLPEWAQGSEDRPSLFDGISRSVDPAIAWRRLGMIDAIAHVHRLDLPVMLTAGSEDVTCPEPSIRSLYDVLPGTRSLTVLKGEGHGYTAEFAHLAASWFRLYA